MQIRTKTITIIAILLVLGVNQSCNKDEGNTTAQPEDPVADVLNLPATPFNYSAIPLPGYLTTAAIIGQINTPPTNVINNNTATLGRVLFYDKSLSPTMVFPVQVVTGNRMLLRIRLFAAQELTDPTIATELKYSNPFK